VVFHSLIYLLALIILMFACELIFGAFLGPLVCGGIQCFMTVQKTWRARLKYKLMRSSVKAANAVDDFFATIFSNTPQAYAA
jgi:hypothetical protein